MHCVLNRSNVLFQGHLGGTGRSGDMKKIIHIDADCFFAALEMRENPSLQEVPLAVGGNPKTRGVIATCNYMARKHGVRSAMAAAYAKRLCPSLVIVKPNFPLYREASIEMREIFSRYSDIIEPLSLDEAYLDVSESKACRGSATWIAEEIRQSISREIGITVSAGVAPVKFLAKISSDWNKPNGLFTLEPGEVKAFCAELPLNKLPGVGKVTARKLSKLGLHQGRDILACEKATLLANFGSFAHPLLQMAQGVDSRNVIALRERKSISVERTFASDLPSLQSLGSCLDELIANLNQRYTKLSSNYSAVKRFVKLKFDNFQQTTIEMTLAQQSDPFSNADFLRLVTASWYRHKRAVRLMGVGFRLRNNRGCPEQLSLYF